MQHQQPSSQDVKGVGWRVEYALRMEGKRRGAQEDVAKGRSRKLAQDERRAVATRQRKDGSKETSAQVTDIGHRCHHVQAWCEGKRQKGEHLTEGNRCNGWRD